MAAFELKAIITAKDRLSPKLTELQKKLKKFRNDSVAGRRGTLGIAAGLAGSATASLTSFAKQEEAATDLKVSMMDASGKVVAHFEKINKLAIKLGNKLPGTTADFQNMMQMLVRQGIPAENILNGVGQASAYLAVQLKKTPESAAEFATKMQDATGTASKDMMGLFDTIQRAFYLGVDDNNLLSYFIKTSSIIKMIDKDGLSAAKSLAPIGVMMDQMGMQGEAAGNAVRKVIQAGLDVKKVRGMNKKLQRFKINLDFTNKKGAFGGLDNLFTQLEKLKKLTDVQRTAVIKGIFGDDAETLQVVNALIDKGREGYNEVIIKMRQQSSLNQRVEAQLKTLKNLWESMTGTAINGLASLGKVFSEDTKDTTIWLNGLSERFDEFVKKNPNVIRSIAGITAGLVGLKFAILGVNVALKVAEITLKTTKIGWLLTAIATLAGLIIFTWKPVSIFFSSLWRSVKESFLSAWAYIKSLCLNLYLIDLIKEKCDPIVGYFKKLWEDIMPYFEPILNGIDKIKSWTANGINWVKDEHHSINKRILNVLPPVDQNPVSTRDLETIGLLNSPFTRNQQGQVTVDFRNLPTGAQVKTESNQPPWFNLDISYKGYSRFARQ